MLRSNEPLSECQTTASFVGRWMDILRPGYERVKGIADDTERRIALEKQAVLVSLENLLTFPFVRDEVAAETLTLHGLWTDTGEGGLEQYDPGLAAFVAV